MPYIERPDISQQKSQSRNEALFPNVITDVGPTFGAKSVPIFIYNVSGLGWDSKDGLTRPPNHPHLTIKACPEGEPYILTGTIEHPFPEVSYDANNNRRIDYTDGYREATVMLSPLNPGRDQNWTMADALNVGGNLNDFGVFWSVHNPPLEQEVAAARARMEKTYRAELEVLAAIEAKNPDDARSRANKISHAAANYFGRSYSWHRSDLVPSSVNQGKIPCWACGESIMPSALLCVHCKAPQAEEKRERWLEIQSGGRGPGRPRNSDTEAA